VLIDLGKKTKVKKYIEKHPAVIVNTYSNGQYTAVMLAGVHKGEILQADVDHIEPFYIREDSCYQTQIELEKKKIDEGHYESIVPLNKGKKRTASAADLQPKTPTKKLKVLGKINATPSPRNTEKSLEETKRSESHKWMLACAGEILVPREARRKPIIISGEN
jgi:hypothetical protein